MRLTLSQAVAMFACASQFGLNQYDVTSAPGDGRASPFCWVPFPPMSPFEMALFRRYPRARESFLATMCLLLPCSACAVLMP